MFYRIIKRIEDIIFSISILIIFSPILVLSSIISLFLQGWPIFYSSKRMVGTNNEITIFKFRTMIKDATSVKYELEDKYMKDGYLDIPIDSEVYTTFGRLLERTQIVEIPQVIPVLFGKMSFVGNRPLPQKNIEIMKNKYPHKWHLRFDSPMGITGISQVVGKFEINSDQRLELESLYSKVYQEGNILKADAYIFFSTIILLLLQDSSAYRSYESAEKVLRSCLKV